jgi:hypothetical protein
VADVTQLPGVFEQVRLVAGVRWRILKNGLRKKHNVWDLIAMIWVCFFSGAIVIGLAFAFFTGGYEFLAKGHIGLMSLLFWGIFLWWQVFPIFVAGFGSNFEFGTLLRFPLSLRDSPISRRSRRFAGFFASLRAPRRRNQALRRR